MSLIKKLKELKEDRKDYRIKPCFNCKRETKRYLFYLLPTVLVQPWIYRYPNTYVVSVCWLNFKMGFGLWERKTGERK